MRFAIFSPAITPTQKCFTSAGRNMPSTIQGDDAALAHRLAIAAMVLSVLGCAALYIDLFVTYPFVMKKPGPIWEICREGIQKGAQPGESFANGWVIVFLLMAIYAVDVARRRQLLRVAVVIAAVGILANVGKLCFGRFASRLGSRRRAISRRIRFDRRLPRASSVPAARNGLVSSDATFRWYSNGNRKPYSTRR